jgi:hypothetical protein
LEAVPLKTFDKVVVVVVVVVVALVIVVVVVVIVVFVLVVVLVVVTGRFLLNYVTLRKLCYLKLKHF